MRVGIVTLGYFDETLQFKYRGILNVKGISARESAEYEHIFIVELLSCPLQRRKGPKRSNIHRRQDQAWNSDIVCTHVDLVIDRRETLWAMGTGNEV